jgi:hypothetical protein
MAVEYLVVQAVAEEGAFGRLSAPKLNKSWETLQEALDELGQHEWDLYTTIYSATREHGGRGEHYCEGLIFKRRRDSVGERASARESLSQGSRN